MQPVAIITGAGSGIGKACAYVLATRGDAVVCADLDGEAATRTAASISTDGGTAVSFELDVSDADACVRMAASAIAQLGAVDVLVCAAGIERGGPAHELDLADYRATMAVNVDGSFFAARAVARHMIAAGSGGRIVLVGSINSQIALRGQAAYCASKGAVLMLGRALAVDWAEFGITVNVVGPGVTDTPMSSASLGDPARREMLMGRIPMGRPARPDDIAGAVAFLTSPTTSYVTGAYLPVDGGWLAG